MRYPLPDKFYRYRAANDHARDIVENCRLYYSKVEKLDDPLDCRVGFDFTASPKLFDECLRDNAMRKGIPMKGVRQMSRNYRAKRQKGRDEMAKLLAENWLKNVQEKIRVCCFCEEGLSRQMFERYGDGHRGICLEFSKQIIADIQFLLPVTYLPKLKRPNFYETYKAHRLGTSDFVNCAFTRKLDDYIFEKEWRAITHDAGDYVAFSPDNLIGVTFGCQCSPDTVQSVLKWQKPGRPLLFWKAMLSEPNFDLVRVPL